MSAIEQEIALSLSLREPQARALEVLGKAFLAMSPVEDEPLAQKLERLRAELPEVEDFERAFPSLTFALATGVGKTRLMGAFIAYLFLEHGLRHFFVLAPNLTIYRKLIADFTPGSPKYVFKGVEAFAVKAPTIVTGDDFEEKPQVLGLFERDDIVINIFNISKFNARAADSRKIRRLSEYLGESYFDHLAGLDDLVILMDEAHRYRAEASMKAIEELQPVLGLELTATPQVESAKGPQRFKNVAVDYPLWKAMKDGYVKEPAVATRDNFERGMEAARLEELKLSDGLRVHEHTRAELELYARQSGRPVVKPFMLVIARDVEHASKLVEDLESERYAGGKYKGKVIQIHSAQKGAERDETVERLLAVERASEATEIVVHVNMLKEGWDVTNLYTIVPLRAADSKTLVEQAIGRGLRLPYGQRTGHPAVDRLTIIAHDKFDEIVRAAKESRFDFQRVNVDELPEPKKVVSATPAIAKALGIAPPGAGGDGTGAAAPPDPLLEATRTTLDVLQTRRHGATSTISGPVDTPEVQKELAKAVATQLKRAGRHVPEQLDLLRVAEQVTQTWARLVIDVPHLDLVEPVTESGYARFDVDMARIPTIAIDDTIQVKSLVKPGEASTKITAELVGQEEPRLENYIVHVLSDDRKEIDYAANADLLYELAGQVVAYLRKEHGGDDATVRKVLLSHQKTIGDEVFDQMEAKRFERTVQLDRYDFRGFVKVENQQLGADPGEEIRPLDAAVDDKLGIRGMVFGGFRRCLYDVQKFDSDEERRFAQILESDPVVLKWFKPARNALPIRYGADSDYEPDFVVETTDAKLLCEPKRTSEVDDEIVQAKAAAAVRWCARATEWERKHGHTKPWRYVLIPGDAIKASATLDGLVRRYAQEAKAP